MKLAQFRRHIAGQRFEDGTRVPFTDRKAEHHIITNDVREILVTNVDALGEQVVGKRGLVFRKIVAVRPAACRLRLLQTVDNGAHLQRRTPQGARSADWIASLLPMAMIARVYSGTAMEKLSRVEARGARDSESRWPAVCKARHHLLRRAIIDALESRVLLSVSVTGVSPGSGPYTGATTVQITGAGFLGASTVLFGGVAAASFVVNTDGQITAVDPPGSGVVDVQVTNGSSTSPISSADKFNYIPVATTVNSSNSAAIFGQSVTFTATVMSSLGSGETGTVQFQVDGSDVGTPANLVANTATYATNLLSVGTHAVVAIYSGDTNYPGSTSAAFTQSVALSPGSSCPPGTYSTTGFDDSSARFADPGYYDPASGETSELQSPAGTYAPGYGTVTPTNDPAGYYAPAGSSAPTIDPAGDFCPAGSASPTTDPAGYYCPAGSASPTIDPAGDYCPAGSASPTTDPAGYYAPAGSSAPIIDPAGDYCPAGSASPTTDPAGYYCPTGSASPTICPAGYYAAAGSATPTPVAAGTYSTVVGASSSAVATPAGTGYYVPTSGSSTETPASPGYYVPTTGATNETPASPGHYVSSSGSSSQITAPAGTFVSTTAATAPTPVAVGTYSTTVGATSSSAAMSAGLGYYVPTAGATAETPASPGYYVPATGSSAETPASPGYYVASSGSSAETPASPGYYVSSSGASSETIAPAGTYVSTTAATAPTPVAAGTYSTIVGATSSSAAMSAGLGYYVPTTGATAETPASPGYYVPATGSSAETPASPGYYVASSGSSAETPASPGYYVSSSGASSETIAPAGTYVSTTAATAPTPVAAGTYSTTVGATSSSAAQSAGLGYYVPTAGATAETPASPGYYVSTTGSSTETPASPGHYVSSAGASSQISAPAGTYVSTTAATAATPVAAGTYSTIVGATSSSVAQSAGPGYYVPTAGATAETPASPGYYVPATGSSAETPAAPGYYVAATGSSAATLALPGYYVASLGSSADTPASPGHYVPSAGASSQITAPAGTYVSTTAATAPTPVAAGTYSTIVGATSSSVAQSAGPGYYVPTTGATAETPASPGYYVPTTGSSAETPASPGHYVSASGASSQLTAPAGTYVSASGASVSTTDPVGTWSPQGAVSPTPFTVNTVNITYGTALANGQLTGNIPLAGAYSYNNASGLILGAGNGQTEGVTFTPTDTTDYAPAFGTVTVNVAGAPLVLSGSSYLELDPAAAGQLDVWAGTTNSGTPSTYQSSNISSITDSGGGNTLTVDFTNGNPLAAITPGISFTTRGSADALVVVGDNHGDTYNASAGQVVVSGGTSSPGFTDATITFTGTLAESIQAGTGPDALAVSGDATVSYIAPVGGAYPTAVLSSLMIGSGSKVVFNSPNSTRALLELGSASTWNGQLDLKTNDLLVHGGVPAFNIVNSLVSSGYSSGAWTGPGISSSAAANISSRAALGVNLNTQGLSYDGAPILTTDTLVRYAYYGDATLDGQVDGSDYSKIDNGYINGLTGWANGDFNYDRVIDGSDYTLIDNAYNRQDKNLVTNMSLPAATDAAEVALPKPVALHPPASVADVGTVSKSKAGTCAQSLFSTGAAITFAESTEQSLVHALDLKDLLDGLSMSK